MASIKSLSSCALLAGVAFCRTAGAQTDVSVDFKTPADYPLLKDKLNLYDTSLPSTQELERDAPLLGLLNVESMRLEQAWGYGQTLSNVVSGTPSALAFDFASPDRWQDLISAQGTYVQWAYNYTPKALSGNAGDVPPPDGWATCVEHAFQHWLGRPSPVLFHEVWNEPDFPALGFFNGSQQDYFELYARTSRQLRALDGDAKIAGPATAFPFWLNAFVDHVRQNQLPLDVLTFHQYTRLGDNDHTAQAASALARYPELDTVEMALDEYHPYNPWPKDGPQQTFECATDLLFDALRFSRRPELASVSWAQFQEPGHATTQYLGLITDDGHPKAAFNALRLYGMLPVDSVVVQTVGAPLDTMASADEHRGALVLLNRTGAPQSVKVALKSGPFPHGKVRTYRIDAQHNSYLNGAGEQLTASDESASMALADWHFTGDVPNLGTLAFLFDDETGYEPPKVVSLAKIVRVNRFYPSRSTTAYADFDRRTWVARLGMVKESQANEQVGATIEGLPPVLRFTSLVSGQLRVVDKNSALGVRLDFQTAGGYTDSVLFYGSYHGGPALYDASRDGRVPYGTKQQANRAILVPELADFSVELAKYAPVGATGRVQLTYVMQNTGVGTRAVFKASAPLDEPVGGVGGGGGSASGGASGTAGAGTGLGGTASPVVGMNGASGASAPGGAAGSSGLDGDSRSGNPGSPSSCACGLASEPWHAQYPAAWLLLGWLRRRATKRRANVGGRDAPASDAG